jgi:SEL1 protein
LLKTVAERGEWASILKEAYTDYQNGFDRKSLILYLQAAEEGFEVAQSNAAWLLERPRAADLFPDEKLRRALALRYVVI